MNGGSANQPLAGIRVVDLTRVMTGPFCTMMLGDLGADVIKVEMPGRGDDTRGWGPPFIGDEAVYFLSANRNKRSIALDLKSTDGKDALWALIDSADVLVENFSPRTLERLGFGYETVKARKPELVFAAISGFGQSGPDFQRTAYDLIVQGMSGMMSITGHPENGMPTRLGVPVADIGAGMFAAFAISSALFNRERTGEGCRIDASMLGGQVALLTYQAAGYLQTGRNPGMLGNGHPMIAPYDTFPCADGYINIAVGNDAMWQRFCTALGHPELLEVERWKTNAGRVMDRAALFAALDPILGSFSRDELVQMLDAAAVPCGPIRTVEDALNDPQVLHEGLVQTMEHATAGEIRVTGAPYQFNGEQLASHRAAPVLGQHTREILAEVGYSSERTDALIDKGAVTAADLEEPSKI